MSLSRTGDNDRLGEVIAKYLQAEERGERPDRSAFLAAHPNLAAELAAQFADHDRLNCLAAPLHLSDPTATIGLAAGPGSTPTVRYVGDYEVPRRREPDDPG